LFLARNRDESARELRRHFVSSTSGSFQVPSNNPSFGL
jgi:hypothetical protein